MLDKTIECLYYKNCFMEHLFIVLEGNEHE